MLETDNLQNWINIRIPIWQRFVSDFMILLGEVGLKSNQIIHNGGGGCKVADGNRFKYS